MPYHQSITSSRLNSPLPPPPPLPAAPPSSSTDQPPPIPTRTRYNSTNTGSRRRSTAGGAIGSSKRQSVPPAGGPEVISSLITSLSGISKPADDYFEGKGHTTSTAASTAASTPGVTESSPATPSAGSKAAANAAIIGSFGVDYGAYKKRSLGDLHEDPPGLDEIAASAPIIRTSKPTSGYSPLSPPKTPKSHSSRDGGTSGNGGLRSFIRSSSTPSRASSHEHDDTNSIGNLSIERHSGAPEPELQRRRSNDSWGQKASRSYKGLMYMTSRERLRDNQDRKRSSGGGGSTNGLRHSHSHSNLESTSATMPGATKPDPFLAETAISEEPSANEGSVAHDSPRPIPNRESSLRRSTTNGKRMSGRRSLRDSVEAMGSASEALAEERVGRKSRSNKNLPTKLDLESPANGKGHAEHGPANPQTPNTQKFLETIRDDYLAYDSHSPANEEDDEGAPFPSVSQNRRRSAQSLDRGSRRQSLQNSPGPDLDGRPKRRNSSRLKRLSRPASPTDSRKASQDAHRDDGMGAPLERLDSVDSIDDAVDAYLCSPRLTQKIRHPQTGRTICFSEVGDSEGSAVFCCVGMGLTRYITAFYDELALTLKLRLITPDRPGVGESAPYEDGATTPLNWPDDVYAICQALKITKFSILAHSAGAIYALATALRMPQHIRGRIHLLAPWIPPSQMNVFGTNSPNQPPTQSMPTSQRILRALPTPVLKVANSSFMSATSTSITTSLPKNPRRSKRKSAGTNKDAHAANRNVTPSHDKENLQNPDNDRTLEYDKGQGGMGARTQSMTTGTNNRTSRGNVDATEAAVQASVVDAMADQERQITYDTRLTHAIWELATTGANPAVDLLICLERRHTIGFRYVDINRPVTIHHGSRDTRVPVDNVRWLGKTMRRCEVRVLEGEGHGLMASAGVMGSVLMEISKEWEDWMRVTGADGRKEKEKSRRGTIRT